MPRYRYCCEKCEETFEMFHSYKEIFTDCVKCDTSGSLKKQLNVPHYARKSMPAEDTKVGDITHQFIEENRDILRQQKQQIKKEKNVKD